ncbi:FAD-dependent oxidoreductase [Actinomadura sediminis]|uniref:FAD-dependent oxidoreductase n=1 Tax=Actinomadura sediminis TaxID=1038904 RepID=A0ABW3EHI2_9ACTN
MTGVVVIGGGVIGLSVAAHLARDGVETTLLERGELGSGASRATADVLRSYFAGDPDGSRLAARSLRAYAASGVPMRRVGYLVLFTDPGQVAAFEAELPAQRDAGVRVELIGADEARRRNPLVEEPDLLAAAWSPDAFVSDTGRIVRWFAQEAERAGAVLRTHCEVTAVDADAGRVETPDGPVTAGAIVCAAGAWSPWITSAAGVDVALTGAAVQELLITGPIPGLPEIPVTLHAASGLLTRARDGALLIGMGHPGTDREEWLARVKSRLARTCPAVDPADLRTAMTGPRDASPDRSAFIGRRPGTPMFLYATGFSGHGLCQAPAAGEVVSALYHGRDPGIAPDRLAAARLRPDRIVIDGRMRDVHEQNERLRRAGPVVPVELPGPVRAWAVTRNDALQAALVHPDLSKELRHWADWADGRVPRDWPLSNIVTAQSMITKEGAEHRRLRALVNKAFTARHVDRLRPRIAHHAAALLDALAGHAPGPVDLRLHYAYPLPRNVICELVGMPETWHADLHKLTDSLIRVTDDADYAASRMGTLRELFAEVIDLRRREPGDDLTSALIAVRDEEGRRLTERELHDMVMTLFIAGHETTINLITNAARALLAHPGELARLRSGTLPWSAAVEETLRWDSPVAYFPMRYAVRDVDLGGVRIGAGDAVVACYAAAGRDGRRYADADRFRPSDPPADHLSFGHGEHFCLGAALARTEAEIALESLFTAFPDLAPAGPSEGLEPLATPLSNSVRTLPVMLGSPA